MNFDSASLIESLGRTNEARTSKDVEFIYSTLVQMPAFDVYSDITLRYLALVLTVEHCTTKDIIFYRQGAEAIAMYVILSGEVEILSIDREREHDNNEKKNHGKKKIDCAVPTLLRSFGQGAVFGEDAVSSPNPTVRMATVIIREPSVLLRLDKAGWNWVAETVYKESGGSASLFAPVESDSEVEDDEKGYNPITDDNIAVRSKSLCFIHSLPSSGSSTDTDDDDNGDINAVEGTGITDRISRSSQENETNSTESDADDADQEENANDANSPSGEANPMNLLDHTVYILDETRAILAKTPEDRTIADVNQVFEEILHLPGFARLPVSLRHDLCEVMLFEEIEEANTTIFSQGDPGTSWFVILKGNVDVVRNGEIVTTLFAGQEFGALALMTSNPRAASIITVVPNVHLVRVEKQDYNRIVKEFESKVVSLTEHGQTVMKLEIVNNKFLVSSGTPVKLFRRLVEEKSGKKSDDPTYMCDFLFMYRTFWTSAELREQIVAQLESVSHSHDASDGSVPHDAHYNAIQDLMQFNIIRIIKMWSLLFWADFANDEEQKAFLLRSYHFLEKKPTHNIKKIGEWRSKLTGLRNLLQEHELLPMDYVGVSNEVINNVVPTPDVIPKKSDDDGPVRRRASAPNWSKGLLYPNLLTKAVRRRSRSIGHTVKRILNREGGGVHKEGRGSMDVDNMVNGSMTNSGVVTSISDTGLNNPWANANTSNQDDNDQGDTISSISVGSEEVMGFEIAERKKNCFSQQGMKKNFVRVFIRDHNYRTVQVLQQTQVKTLLVLLITRFELEDKDPDAYELVIVSSCGTETILKPDDCSVASHLAINGRFLMRLKDPNPVKLPPKNIEVEEDAYFLNFDSREVARQLTMYDHKLFSSIDPLEFIFHLYKQRTQVTSNLNRFIHRFNEINLWVVTTVLTCKTHKKCTDIIKKFIKVAVYCRNLNNFNSTIAIVSGLSNVAVTRLKVAWEKVPKRFVDTFKDIETLLDPSRNMKTYRTVLADSTPPLIPFFPLYMKDVTFIHEGNSDLVDDLIYFDKLRMMSARIRENEKFRNTLYTNMQEIEGKRPCSAVEVEAIRHYLKNIAVVDNQRTITALSKAATKAM